MYAVIKTGGKQYKVAPGEKLKVEQIPADVGAEVILDQVLMVGDGESVRLGQPVVAGATVNATVLAHGRGDKVTDLQDAAAQALPEASGSSAGLHRAQDRRHRRLIGPHVRSRQTSMAHKKAGGSSRNGRDSHSKRLGVKAYGGEAITAGAHHRPAARHQGSSRQPTSASARITRCLRWSTARSSVRDQGQRQAHVRQRRAGGAVSADIAAVAAAPAVGIEESPPRRGFFVSLPQSCFSVAPATTAFLAATTTKATTGNAAENSGGQSLMTPR